MLARLPAPIRVPLALLLLFANTLVHALLLFIVALVKLALPVPRLRRRLSRMLASIAESWIAFNSCLFRNFTTTRFEVRGMEDLRPEGRYLVLSNHRSWVDIPVLQRAFNRRVPFMRFFLKSQLIWVPVLGLAWWALDFPFVKRYTREQIERSPELRGRDLEATRRACERFRDLPVSIVNFVEGTRFNEAKRDRQGSPYRHLLRPRAGGVSFVLQAIGADLDAILDVTLSYRPTHPTMKDLLANRVGSVQVDVREIPIPAEFVRSEDADEARSERFRAWLNELWSVKDAMLDEAGRTTRER
ncbi:MAG TPA: acyltransferase [Xanthomonadaceae bacterium]|nr:acyltransferase [Xanthomonadaceae bacterium]